MAEVIIANLDDIPDSAPPASGLPVGGSPGQFLTKDTTENYKAVWTTVDAVDPTIVKGPASATNLNPVVFDGTTGKLVKEISYLAFKTDMALVKADVGLNNVDNTSNVTERAAVAALTNKTIDAGANTLSALTLAMFAANVIDTDGTLAANSDTRVATQKAVKTLFATVASGVHYINSVRAISTANVVLATAVENGDTLNGVVLATGDRILLKDQTAKLENGVYTVNVSGAPTRATDADASAEIVGSAVSVGSEPSSNGSTLWVCITPATITPGVTAIEYTKVPGVTYSAGAGLTLTAGVFAADTGTSGHKLPYLDASNTFSAAQTIVGTTTIQDNAADANDGPILRLLRNSASPADNDHLAVLNFAGMNESAAQIDYAQIRALVLDATGSTEDARGELWSYVAGTNARRLLWGAGLWTPNATGGDKGADTINVKHVYVDGAELLPAGESPYSLFGTGQSKTTKQRWVNMNTLWLGPDGDFDLDLTGSAGGLETALAAAIATAYANNKKEIRIPASTPTFTGTVDILQPTEIKNLSIIGVEGLTQFGNKAGNFDWIHLGPGGATDVDANKTQNVKFINIEMTPNTPLLSGKSILRIRNAKFCEFINCGFINVRQAARIGLTSDGATGQNDSRSISFIDTAFTPKSDSAVAMLQVGSFGNLRLYGFGYNNANGTAGNTFVQHNDPLHADGLYIYNMTFGDFFAYIESLNGGMANVQIYDCQLDGGTNDGGTRHFYGNSALDNGWQIYNNQMLNGTPGADNSVLRYPLRWNSPGKVLFQNNRMNSFTGYLQIQQGFAKIQGNSFESGGRKNVELIRMEGASGCIISGNDSNTVAGQVGAATHAVNWVTSNPGVRKFTTDDQLWRGLTDTVQNGAI